jgi:cell division protein FtsB/DNA-directed RNA polymerase subunit RPC12/RpoP
MYYPDDEYWEPTVADEIFESAQEKLRNALKDIIKSEIEELKTKNEYLEKSNNELRGQVAQLDNDRRKFEKNKDDYVQNGIKQYQREILMGLRPGDNVWTIRTETQTETCKHCNGTHKIKATIAEIEKDVECPHCSYNGKIIVNKTHTPSKRVVSQVTLKIWNDKPCFQQEIYLESKYNECSEVRRESYDHYASFYYTEEDCLKECNNLNEKWAKE